MENRYFERMPPVIRDVDPRLSLVPPSRPEGADPGKLIRQKSRYGASAEGMPLPQVYEMTDGRLMLNDGVTRATRIAELSPGTSLTVKIVGRIKSVAFPLPAIGDLVG